MCEAEYYAKVYCESVHKIACSCSPRASTCGFKDTVDAQPRMHAPVSAPRTSVRKPSWCSGFANTTQPDPLLHTILAEQAGFCVINTSRLSCLSGHHCAVSRNEPTCKRARATFHGFARSWRLGPKPYASELVHDLRILYHYSEKTLAVHLLYSCTVAFKSISHFVFITTLTQSHLSFSPFYTPSLIA